MLALVIVLSGCFGMGANETDAQNNSENANILPVIYIESVNYCANGPDWTSCDVDGDTAEDLNFHDANPTFVGLMGVWDYDGQIMQFGIDWNMDSEIDWDFWSNGSLVLSGFGPVYANADVFPWLYPEEYPSYLDKSDGTPRNSYQFVNVIAVDNDGGTTIIPLRASLIEGENGVAQFESFPDYVSTVKY